MAVVVTVNVWSAMLAAPTTAGPVAKFVGRPPHGQRHGGVRAKNWSGDPLQNGAVDPLVSASHRRCRSDVGKRVRLTPVGDGRAERDHRGVRHRPRHPVLVAPRRCRGEGLRRGVRVGRCRLADPGQARGRLAAIQAPARAHRTATRMCLCRGCCPARWSSRRDRGTMG